jgi:hypothetical protein
LFFLHGFQYPGIAALDSIKCKFGRFADLRADLDSGCADQREEIRN